MATNKNVDVYREDRSQDSNQININICELEQSKKERTLVQSLINRKVRLSDFTNSFWKKRNQQLEYKLFDKSISSFILNKKTLVPITVTSYIHILEELHSCSLNFNFETFWILKYKFRMKGTNLMRN